MSNTLNLHQPIIGNLTKYRPAQTLKEYRETQTTKKRRNLKRYYLFLIKLCIKSAMIKLYRGKEGLRK